MIGRRKLLASGLLATLGAGSGSCKAASGLRVAIVGAGMAGLSAARDLRGTGCDVTVFEARQRIGGRIHTKRHMNGIPVDVGASWIHGIDGNPVAGLARTAAVRTIATSYESSTLHIQPELRARGIEDSDEELGRRVVTHAMTLAAKAPRDISLRAAVDLAVKQMRLTANQRLQVDFYLAAAYEQEYSGSSTELSAWTIDDGSEFEGADVLFPDGYDRLPQFLALGSTIRTGLAVRRIEWGGKGVTLRFADDSSQQFDAVLVTVPLGVLKAGDIAFEPRLPAAKRQAIQRLGMGLLNKHWLLFERAFWPSEFDWHEYLSERPGRWQEWVSLAKHGIPMLLVFSGGDQADAIERMSDRQILDEIVSAARSMFGSGIPEPRMVEFTRWRADPFTRGSYSFNAVGSDNSDRRELAKGEAGRLYFAGEAANAEHPGTVHGAFMSGRAAAALIKREARAR